MAAQEDPALQMGVAGYIAMGTECAAILKYSIMPDP
jgi:hypothetical protein